MREREHKLFITKFTPYKPKLHQAYIRGQKTAFGGIKKGNMQKDSIIEKVKDYIRATGIASAPAAAIAGLSGGADSVAMAHILKRLGYEVIAAHCNFHLRGGESDRDEAFVRDFCSANGIELRVEHYDTFAYAEERGISIEMAARELRYGFFRRLRDEHKGSHIFIAHHADDSIETALLNLLRGTGLKGLCGISPVNNGIMRPLLCLGRADIEAYIAANSLGYVTDSTNLGNDYMRNKIRHLLLPLMNEISPGFRSTMLANIENLRLWQRACELWTAEKLAEIVTMQEDGRSSSSLIIPKVKESPSSTETPAEGGSREENKIQTADISKLLASGTAEVLLHSWLAPYGFNPGQVKQILERIACPERAEYLSPTHALIREQGRLRLSRRSAGLRDEGELRTTDGLRAEAGSRENGGLRNEDELRNEGENLSIEAYLSIERISAEGLKISPDPNIAYLDADKLKEPLTLRRWQPGDRIRPLGMKGMKKVSDLLSSLRLSSEQRSRTLVLLSAGEIAWVVGVRISEDFKICGDTRNVVVVRDEE